MQAREEQDRSQRSAQEQLAEIQTQFQSMKVCISFVCSVQSRSLKAVEPWWPRLGPPPSSKLVAGRQQ